MVVSESLHVPLLQAKLERSPIAQLLEGSQRSLAELPKPVLKTFLCSKSGLNLCRCSFRAAPATIKTVSEEPNNLDDVRIADGTPLVCHPTPFFPI